MTEEILINVTPQETRVAVVQQGVVQEVQIERASARGLVSNICMGRVVRVLPGMQSAFIEIGLERAAFLHVADIWEARQNGEPPKPIERILTEGFHNEGPTWAPNGLFLMFFRESGGSGGPKICTTPATVPSAAMAPTA